MIRPLVLQCSPRAGGNSDVAARAFAQGLAEAGARPRVLALRDFQVRPCRGCGACAGGRACVLGADDDAGRIFELLLAAPLVAVAAPIYFYHLPAGFKALIDRSQALYERREAGDPAMTTLAQRPAWALLLAGRPRGERLFEGSLLTLKYFLAVFGLRLAGHLEFRGKDGPEALARDAEALERLRLQGAQTWSSLG